MRRSMLLTGLLATYIDFVGRKLDKADEMMEPL